MEGFNLKEKKHKGKKKKKIGASRRVVETEHVFCFSKGGWRQGSGFAVTSTCTHAINTGETRDEPQARATLSAAAESPELLRTRRGGLAGDAKAKGQSRLDGMNKA